MAQEVRQARQYIRSALYTFPALTYRTETYGTRLSSEATYVRPDIIIRKGVVGFEIELIEKKRYQFSINTESRDPLNNEIPKAEIQRYMHLSTHRATFFIDCIHRPWHTLMRVAALLVTYQS